MATAVISGRVDERVRDRANAYIHAAGLTAADVVKIVWENIAQSGVIPIPVQDDPSQERTDPLRALYALRADLQELSHDGAGALADLTEEQARDAVADALMEKYGYA